MLLLLAVYKVEIKVVAVPKRKGYIQKGGWFDPLEKTVQKCLRLGTSIHI